MLGRVYKLTNPTNNLIYIGSTTQTLANRMRLHRRDANRGINYPIYQAMREIGTQNFDIELIEEREFANIRQLREREHHYIATLNTQEHGYNRRGAIFDRPRKIRGIYAWRAANPEKYNNHKRRYNEKIKAQKELARLFAELPFEIDL